MLTGVVFFEKSLAICKKKNNQRHSMIGTPGVRLDESTMIGDGCRYQLGDLLAKSYLLPVILAYLCSR